MRWAGFEVPRLRLMMSISFCRHQSMARMTVSRFVARVRSKTFMPMRIGVVIRSAEQGFAPFESGVPARLAKKSACEEILPERFGHSPGQQFCPPFPRETCDA